MTSAISGRAAAYDIANSLDEYARVLKESGLEQKMNAIDDNAETVKKQFKMTWTDWAGIALDVGLSMIPGGKEASQFMKAVKAVGNVASTGTDLLAKRADNKTQQEIVDANADKEKTIAQIDKTKFDFAAELRQGSKSLTETLMR